MKTINRTHFESGKPFRYANEVYKYGGGAIHKCNILDQYDWFCEVGKIDDDGFEIITRIMGQFMSAKILYVQLDNE